MAKKDKKSKDKKGKGGKKSSGNNAFAKDYELPESMSLDGVYAIKVKSALDKKTSSGKALVIEGDVIVDKKTKVKFSHYINYENKNENAVAMARAQIEDIADIISCDVDLDDMIESLNEGPKLFAKVKTVERDGYSRPNIQSFISPDDVDED